MSFSFYKKTQVAGHEKLRWTCNNCGHRFNTIPQSAGTPKVCSKCEKTGILDLRGILEDVSND